MNTDSQFDDRSPSQLPSDVANGMAKYTNESTGTKDMEKRDCRQHNEADRFELLSAYLDGEVTAAERKQVEQWLSTDDSVKCLYARLLKLRQGVKMMPIPASAQSPEATFQQVWKRLSYRYQLGWMFGGAAVAACIIGSISGFIPGNTSKLQLAQQKIQPITVTTQPAVPTSPLMVALNNPVIEIPKTAVASPKKPVNQSKTLEKGTELDIN
ncbi:anti-sigma factor family protein [Sphaerospermopsis torques-reginae]|uniref:Transcriptional regulator n=1 Tax=Sphaerospermopsis torques-reginae ITEP-024 TaxID=984208 RepID=A0ABX8X189_9CYAN|nr:transcriptional regulator [Sphaerospermopsis torques-reginae]QYX32332.1 transcriptional regulator [Sphaerospermopsis torques-reginae ITEP-024]